MNERKWKEFGKMWDAMEKDDSYYFGIEFIPSNETDEKNESPYDVLKRVYFEQHLNIPDTVDVEFDLPDEYLNELYIIADDQGKIIDEVIIDIIEMELEDQHETYGPAECCFHCGNAKDAENYLKKPTCQINGKTVHRSFTCNQYKKK